MTIRAREVAVVLAWAAAYALAMWLGRATGLEGGQLALVWPAAGVSFLWLHYRWPARRRWYLDLTVLAGVTCLVDVLTGSSLPLAAALGAVNVLQAATAVALYRRLVPDGGLRTGFAFRALAAAALTGATASGAVIAPVLMATLGGDLPVVAGGWVLRNAVSTLVVGAVGLRLLGPGRPRWRSPGGGMELDAMVVVLAVTSWAVFGAEHDLSLAFLVLPVSLWISARASTTVATVHVLALGVVVVVGTLAGRGPFTTGDPMTDVSLAQAFVLVLAAVSFGVALGRDERERLYRRLVAERTRAEATRHELATVLRCSRDGVMVLDRDGGMRLVNPAATAMLGTPADASRLAWEDYYRVLGPDGTPVPLARWPASRALAGESVEGVDLLVSSAGSPQTRTLSVSAAPLPPMDGGGTTGGAVLSLHDVTADRLSQLEIRRHRDRLTAVLQAATEQSVVGTDPDGVITLFTAGAERMLGRTQEDTIGRTLDLLHDPDEIAAVGRELGVPPGVEVLLHTARTGHRTETRRWTYLHRDGGRLQVRLSVGAMHDPEGNLTGFIGVGTDVTRQVAAEQELAESEARFRRAFESAPVGMLLLGQRGDQRGRVLRVNVAMCELTGRAEDALLASRIDQLVAAEDAPGCLDTLEDVLSGATDHPRCEVRFVRPDGAQRWGLMSFSLIPTADEYDAYAVCLVQDVTSRREAEQALAHRALHDPLTGLPNRVLFRDRLEHALAAAERTQVPAGVLFIDLDGFKQVNDRAGHTAGDEVLRQVAGVLASCVRPADTVARVGGDEFAVLCPQSQAFTVLETVADRVRGAVSSAVFSVGGHAFELGASIGVSMSVGRDSCDQLMQDADAAMYLAKRSGRNAVRVHNSDAAAVAARAARLLPQLRAALEAGELVLHGQPLVDLGTGRTVAVETLVRWRHPTRGLLPPAEFLDVLETCDLMLGAGRFVLDESCRMAASWSELLGPAAPAVHVNVSGRQLEDGTLSREVLTALARHSLPASRLVIELAETHVPLIADSLRRDLQRLREQGVRIAIDDLGTGYSSLARLTELPVDVLKVDRRLVGGLGSDPGCDAIVRGLAGLAKSLGLVVVADGVETPFQANIVIGMGIDTAQGYLYSPPRPERELVAQLQGAV